MGTAARPNGGKTQKAPSKKGAAGGRGRKGSAEATGMPRPTAMDGRKAKPIVRVSKLSAQQDGSTAAVGDVKFSVSIQQTGSAELEANVVQPEAQPPLEASLEA